MMNCSENAVTRSAETRDADSKVSLYIPLYFFGFVPNNIGMDFKSCSFYLEERTKTFKTIFSLLPFFGVGKYYFFLQLKIRNFIVVWFVLYKTNFETISMQERSIQLPL